MMQNKLMVSIDCITYNHESYIADAIESFLMQKTNFAYEILIHDDASTDKTPEILKEYESKYPRLIKIIYEKENQYSKGMQVNTFNWKRALGKYIAVCEGDDYWVDPYKLQKQVDYMEQHPECSLCVHAAYRVSPDKKRLKWNVQPNHSNKIFSVDEIILGGGGLFATNSMFFPAVYTRKLPDFYTKAPIGDYPLTIYLALQGVVYYIDELMSAYRIGAKGSWSESMSSYNAKLTHLDKVTDMLHEINRYTEYKYDIAIKQHIQDNLLFFILDQGMHRKVRSKEFDEIYQTLPLRRKIMVHYFPFIYRKIIALRQRIQR